VITPYSEECARARGERPIPADEAALQVLGAHCDYSARGSRREHWFRLAWRDGRWQYISEQLSGVGMRASTRHQGTYGDVWAGEVVAQHDRGKPVDMMYLITHDPNPSHPSQAHKEPLTFTKRRDGRLSITLPDSSIITLPDPRR
jgi:hypothetical protein